jgi:hypothetical protein
MFKQDELTVVSGMRDLDTGRIEVWNDCDDADAAV